MRTDIEVWYKGKVCSINADTVSIEYDGYTDAFEWPKEDVIEDIRNKELIAE